MRVERLNPQILSKLNVLSLSLAEIESKQRKLAFHLQKLYDTVISYYQYLNTMFTNIGEKIKKVRNDKGLTQEELAQKANISYITLVKIEQGKVENPTMKTLQKIAKALEISLDEIVKNVKQ